VRELPLSPSVLSDARSVAAYGVFFASYFVFALGKFPGLKIDRPGAAIIGAVLMVAFRIMTAQQALSAIDFSTVVLLFSMTLIVAHLHLGGFFDWIAELTVLRLNERQLLAVVIFVSGILSAFLVNDIVCLVLTPFILGISRRLGVAPIPYLLALATASNVGSVATITGNPQNMLIGSVSQIGYLDFLAHLGPVAVGGLIIDWALLHWLYLRRGSLAQGVAVATSDRTPPRPVSIKPVIVLLIVLAGFVSGVPPALMAAVGAALLLITRTTEPRLVYEEVDWGLLVFFIGLFIIVGGAERAGLTDKLLQPFLAWNMHRVWSYSALTALLSNIVSNVPAVVLLKSLVPGFPDPRLGWLTLAMSSTLAGNLTITGSVANIIVVERARPAVHIGFRDYFRLGLPLTLLTLTWGILWLSLSG
jgi:Na+/H+ antiporter NhaD/arsenite permease-like protein